MINSQEADSLLNKLCINLGFCLPPGDIERLVENPPKTSDDFTEAVFWAEGLNPHYAERHFYIQVRAEVAKAFEKHENYRLFDNLKNDLF